MCHYISAVKREYRYNFEYTGKTSSLRIIFDIRTVFQQREMFAGSSNPLNKLQKRGYGDLQLGSVLLGKSVRTQTMVSDSPLTEVNVLKKTTYCKVNTLFKKRPKERVASQKDIVLFKNLRGLYEQNKTKLSARTAAPTNAQTGRVSTKNLELLYMIMLVRNVIVFLTMKMILFTLI